MVLGMVEEKLANVLNMMMMKVMVKIVVKVALMMWNDIF